jgi:hypothetical protein
MAQCHTSVWLLLLLLLSSTISTIKPPLSRKQHWAYQHCEFQLFHEAGSLRPEPLPARLPAVWRH